MILTEKYSVARDFALALKADRANGCFENSSYVIVWAQGHLLELKKPEDYDPELKTWTIKHLPIIPERFELNVSNKAQFTCIKQQLQRTDIHTVIVATDAGREGELIARYILIAAKNKKPTYRVWLNSMTEKDILNGVKEAKPLSQFDKVFDSAQARAESDWLMGINFTRAYTKIYGKGSLFSVGRVQTPILALICKRDEEIEAFVSQTYWELDCKFDADGKKYVGTWFDRSNNSARISSSKAAQVIRTRVKGKKGIVLETNQELKRVPHPLLYNLTNLQRTMNRKYGFTAQKTLDIMQKLYEEYKVVSYPRTSSRHISESMVEQLPTIIKGLQFGRFEKITEHILGLRSLPVTKRLADDSKVSDHTAITPIFNAELESIYTALKEDELKVFDEISLSLLACFYPDYIYNSMSIITQVDIDMFVTRGIEVIQPGWRKVFAGDEEEAPSNIVPLLKKDQKVVAEDVEIRQVKTDPPSHYTEDKLLMVMENPTGLLEDELLKKAIKGHGIGTEATRANIIETLVQRSYVRRQDRALIATEAGAHLIAVVGIDQIKSPALTAEWEQQLGLIAEGEMDKDDFMDRIKDFVSMSVKQIKDEQAEKRHGQ